MKDKPRIVVIGSLVFDFVAKAVRLPRTGETVLGEQFGMFPGGKGANQAVQAGRLGAEVYLVGRLGDDFLADRLLASLAESGVATEFIQRDRSVKTASCCIHVDAHGNNAIIIVPEANRACSPEDVDRAASVLRSADLVLCQLEIPTATVAYALARAARSGVPAILNPAPAQEISGSLLSQVSILTPNETEAEFLTGFARSEDLPLAGESWVAGAAQRLLGLGPRTVIITLGERGAYLATGSGGRLLPAYPVAVVDTTAAGDAFNGALAVALAEGKQIEEAVAFANAAGALATTRAGAQPSLAWREELERFRASGDQIVDSPSFPT
jgi:ribokinase